MVRDRVYGKAIGALSSILKRCEVCAIDGTLHVDERHREFYKLEKSDDGYELHVTRSMADVLRMMGNFARYCGKYSFHTYHVDMYALGKFYLGELNGTPGDIAKIFEPFVQMGLDEYYSMHGNMCVGQKVNYWGRDYLVSSSLDGLEVYLVDLLSAKMFEDRMVDVEVSGEVNRSDMIELLGGLREYEESVIA